jgi:hypothetical protein
MVHLTWSVPARLNNNNNNIFRIIFLFFITFLYFYLISYTNYMFFRRPTFRYKTSPLIIVCYVFFSFFFSPRTRFWPEVLLQSLQSQEFSDRKCTVFFMVVKNWRTIIKIQQYLRLTGFRQNPIFVFNEKKKFIIVEPWNFHCLLSMV